MAMTEPGWNPSDQLNYRSLTDCRSYQHGFFVSKFRVMLGCIVAAVVFRPPPERTTPGGPPQVLDPKVCLGPHVPSAYKNIRLWGPKVSGLF